VVVSGGAFGVGVSWTAELLSTRLPFLAVDKSPLKTLLYGWMGEIAAVADDVERCPEREALAFAPAVLGRPGGRERCPV